MRTVEINLYKFEELSEKSKKVTIEYFRKNGRTSEPLLFFKEYCEEQALELGFYGTVFQYSLSYSQGDGLSFTFESYNNMEKLFNQLLGEGKAKTAKVICDYVIFFRKGGNNRRYCYASDTDIELVLDSYGYGSASYVNVPEIVLRAERRIKVDYMMLCERLEKEGYEILEEYNSDEAIIEDILSYEFEFTADGKIYVEI